VNLTRADEVGDGVDRLIPDVPLVAAIGHEGEGPDRRPTRIGLHPAGS
jgi:hypothetical protein